MKKLKTERKFFKMIDLKKIRDRLGATQIEMARVLGIGQAAYSKLENGGWEVSPDTERRYISNIIEAYPQFAEGNLPQAAVAFQGSRNKVTDVKVSAVDDKMLDLLREQGKQISALIQTVREQNEIILSLSKAK